MIKFLHRYKDTLLSFGVVGAATIIFALRNTAAFTMPNFYAEDATIFFNNVYTTSPIEAIFSLFNGYFVVGQYIVGYIAAVINFIIGGQLATLPVVLAIVSCAFLGLAASLPYLLFHKELGRLLAGVTVLITSLVPMYSFDYAIIGNIGNLKFAFLYIAFLLIVYRIIHDRKLSDRNFLLIDSVLILCVLTNISVVFLLPLLLIPKLERLKTMVKTRKIDKGFLGSVMVIVISVLYVLAALIKGIPSMPGYLDGPFQASSLLPLLDRTTFYAFSYPLAGTIMPYFAALFYTAFFCSIIFIFWKYKKYRVFLALTAWTLFIGTVLFVINRPGVSEYFLNFNHKGGPDQFFYAQNMVFIFAAAWLLKDKIKYRSIKVKLSALCVLSLYIAWALPYGTSFGDSKVVYQYLQPIDVNLQKACNEYQDQEKVIIQIYPSQYWQWHVDRDLACRD